MFKKKKEMEEELDLEIITEEQGEETDIQSFEDSEVKAKKKKLPGWVIFPVLAGVLIIVFVIGNLAGGKQTKTTSLAVEKVEKGEVKEVYTISGIVESEKTKTFYSPVTAPVAACNAKVGTAVKAGDMLIAYDTTDLEKNNQESQLQLQQTQAGNQSTMEQAAQAANAAAEAKQQAQSQAAAQIDSLRKQVSAAEGQVTQLQAQAAAEAAEMESILAARAPKEAELAQVQSELQQLTVAYETAQNEKDNFESLHQGVSEADKQKRLEELGTIIVAYPGSKSSLENKISGIQAELDSMGTPVAGAAQAELAAARQNLDTLRASLEQAQNTPVTGSTATEITGGQRRSMALTEDLAALSAMSIEELVQKGREGIKAEFDGVISDVQVSEGASAAQGTPLFTIASNQSVSVRLEVPSSDFDKLVVGNKATVKVGQKTYNGTVAEVDKIALNNVKGNPVLGARIHIDNPDDEIVIGVTAKATLNVADVQNVLNISNEAVNTGTEGDFVYIIKEGAVRKVNVELGIASNSRVEITSGLKEGDEVVTDASSDLKEGMSAVGVLEKGK